MTAKQILIQEFFEALDNYKEALKTKNNIVLASLKVHAAKRGIPKVYHKLVNRVYSSCR